MALTTTLSYSRLKYAPLSYGHAVAMSSPVSHFHAHRFDLSRYKNSYLNMQIDCWEGSFANGCEGASPMARSSVIVFHVPRSVRVSLLGVLALLAVALPASA